MALTAGVVSLVQATSTSIQLSATAATAGTAPVTYQWYRSTVSGFTPGGGNVVSGATALSLVDTGLIPNTQYFYKLQASDASPTTVTYTQFAAATTVSVLSQNQFALSSYVGVLDLKFNYSTLAVAVDASQPVGTPLYSGAAVKMVDSVDGLPKVIGCTANADGVLGFINFDIKTQQYVGAPSLVAVPQSNLAEISLAGNVMYLYATTAIARGAQVQLDVSTMGGVAALVPSSGACVVGWAVDKAASAGALIRVRISTPSFQVA